MLAKNGEQKERFAATSLCSSTGAWWSREAWRTSSPRRRARRPRCCSKGLIGMPSFVTEFLAEYGELLAEGLGDTLVMLFVSTAIAYVLGIVLGVVLYLTAPGSLRPMRVLNAVLGWVVNIGRSLPFIIFSYVLNGTDSAFSISTCSG